jgi:hypothetical protein
MNLPVEDAPDAHLLLLALRLLFYLSRFFSAMLFIIIKRQA